MEDLKEIADRVFATPGRAKGGVCGQTIEAMSRSTFHQISAWDADALYEAAAEITRLRAALEAMTAERDAARAKALEDAAKVAAGAPEWTDDACDIAAAIRAMIKQEDKG